MADSSLSATVVCSTVVQFTSNMSSGFLQALSRDFHELDDQRRTLAGPLQAASDALRAAAATHDALRVEYEAIEERQRLLRGQLLRATMEAMPPELLRAVFEQLVLQLEEDVEVDRFLLPHWFNAPRFCAPFCLAAVCRKWRDVCMDFHALWTYIGAGCRRTVSAQSGQRYILRTRLLLERSKNIPLCLQLDCFCASCPMNFSWFLTVLDDVVQHTHRWRNVTIYCPLLSDENSLAFLRRPMPLLDYLVLESTPDVIPWNSPVYLPHSPRARHLEFWSTFFVPMAPMTSLVSFHVPVTADTNRLLWTVLENLPNLVDLSVEFFEHLHAITPKVIRRESLKRLCLLGAFASVDGWTNYLEIPNLEVLILHIKYSGAVSAMMSFVEAKCGSLTELHLHGDSSHDGAQGGLMFLNTYIPNDVYILLDGLKARLKVIQLHNWLFCGPSETFFSRLTNGASESDTAVLPVLHTLLLSDMIASSKAADGLCAFARQQLQRSEGPAFKLVISESAPHIYGIPSWADLQLRTLLGDAFVLDYRPKNPSEPSESSSDSKFSDSDGHDDTNPGPNAEDSDQDSI